MSRGEGVDLVLVCPKLVSVDLEHRLQEVHFLFSLYCGFEIEDTIKIFKAFPYMAVVDHRKLTLFCGEFKKYKLTKE
jgi:hypothetical protein